MDSINTTTLIAIVAVAVILIAVVAWLAYGSNQSRRLRERFGPEYDAVLKRHGSKAKAEAELRRRQKRVERFEIVPLAPAEVTRFSQSWKRLQGSFVDDPKGVLIEADRLVRDLLTKRGYPVADFEMRAADISVDHPVVVNNYRAAQRIVSLDQRGEASTEDLRKAVVHFRALFDELLGTGKTQDQSAPPSRLAA
ncbi:MAG: hypothetical protein ACJ8GJ_07190 [Vitreoscilla sp.]